MCRSCDSPESFFSDPAEALRTPELPSEPMCYRCIMDAMNDLAEGSA